MIEPEDNTISDSSSDEIPNDSSETESIAEVHEEASKEISIHGGEELDSISASEITSKYDTVIIVIAGPKGSGKTTLLASIYDSFHIGEFANCTFAESRTLVAFEERSHLARVESGIHAPTATRTPLGAGVQFLHLCVRQNSLPNNSNLLFADMSGEYYRMAKDSAEDCREISILTRADYIALLIDCELLSSQTTRHLCLVDARQLLRRCIEEGMLKSHTNIHILYSKWDVVIKSNCEKELEPVLKDFEQTIRTTVEDKIADMEFFKVAASPKQESSLGLGYGIDTIFEKWVKKKEKKIELDISKGQKSAKREFDRFLSS